MAHTATAHDEPQPLLAAWSLPFPPIPLLLGHHCTVPETQTHLVLHKTFPPTLPSLCHPFPPSLAKAQGRRLSKLNTRVKQVAPVVFQGGLGLANLHRLLTSINIT